MNPSYGTDHSNCSALTFDGHGSYGDVDGDGSSSEILYTIDEDEENPKMQEVESVLDHAVGGNSDSLRSLNENSIDSWQSEEEALTFSKPGSQAKKHVRYFAKKLVDKDKYSSPSRKPKQRSPGDGSINNSNGGYSESMISMANFEEVQGEIVKPLKIWYRSLVIRQSCHSHMAEELIAKDMYLNTISVAITAVTSSAIFTSLVPSSGSQTGGYNSLAVMAGVLAAINTVLQAIVKTMAYNRRGEQHLNAFKMFTRMRFKMENLIGDKKVYSHHEDINDTMLDEWIEKYEELLELEPIIPQCILEEISEKEDNAGLKWTRARMHDGNEG